MPNPGFKSLTIKAETYDAFKKAYKKKEKLLWVEGIFSLAGYANKVLNDSIKEKKK